MVNMQKNILAMIIHKWLKSDYVVIDTETTGLGEYAEIIEIAIINMRGEVLLDTLVKPTQPIPPEVTEINHITNEMVADAPAWCDVFPMVLAIITHHKWLAWNSGFDARMLEQTCFFTEVFPENHPYYAAAVTSRIHTSHIDAKAVYDQWYGEFDEKRKAFKRQSLTTAAARHGVSVEGAHRALADCKMVLAVLQKVGSPVTQTANVSETGLPLCPFCYGPPSLFTYYFDGVPRKPAVGTELFAAPPAPIVTVRELTMWVKRLAHSLRNAKSGSKLPDDAMAYLSAKGLIGVEDALR